MAETRALDRQNAQEDQVLRLRACRSAYIVFTIICTVPILLPLFVGLCIAAPFERFVGMWQPLTLCAGALGFSWLWLASYEVLLTTKTISYRKLFFRRRTMLLSEVTCIRRESGVKCYTDNIRPFYRIVIVGNDQRLTINEKVFELSEVRELLDRLNASLREKQ